jgi:hypothetical protein
VIGSAQYMYGDSYKLSDYEFIQDTLSKATRAFERVDMLLISTSSALEKTSITCDVILKDINMDINYQQQTVPEYNYDDIKNNKNMIPLWDVVEPVKCTIGL